MAHHYYDITGVLVLEEVTPVIEVLFHDLQLDAVDAGPGLAYFAQGSHHGDRSWHAIRDNILALVPHWDDSFIKADGDVAIQSLLRQFAAHFGVDDDATLQQFIAHHDFREAPTLGDRFLLATYFDDGHGLSAIRSEASWNCDELRLFEFGGEGLFISREVVLCSASSHALALGDDLREAVLSGDAVLVAERLALEVKRLLAGITDHSLRTTLPHTLAKLLLAATDNT
ncbi:Uncharacterised protein [Burkholderia pseudomallei]|uniref:hypothetical protein n=1 Tax=Burkholderia pseudomallei TaxID=28450 RepID=UPI000F2D6377|nr:hypothetical protein [Burkholderia pseudomallei]CAJ3214237.1 Uncharacterised protein [Burkholderia pseudomallei]CAJ3564274.1 Uncharacterised protein [Burkholderia pseudomallei]CAJ3604407.1 Uncharacterised protein [Burkholderia pseudomallei]CAJ3644402.1 Uncharacterised protein [Burkholderia pseudomallei]CAJ3705843.1 Uncharacterised protein [Burkholderia pseudomallei]